MRIEFSKGERASKQDAEKVSVLTRPPWCAKTHLLAGSVLASLRDTQRTEAYDSPLRSLRPAWDKARLGALGLGGCGVWPF